MTSMTRSVLILLSIVLLTASSADIRSQPAGPDIARQFVGVWKLVSWTNHWVDGTSTPDRRNVGYIIYTEGGHMCWTGMDSNRPHWESKKSPSKSELESAFFGAAAYCSTVELHIDEGFVLHHVQSAIWPDAAGSTWKRTFEFDGPDRLTLSEDPAGLTPPQAGSVLVWERIE